MRKLADKILIPILILLAMAACAPDERVGRNQSAQNQPGLQDPNSVTNPGGTAYSAVSAFSVLNSSGSASNGRFVVRSGEHSQIAILSNGEEYLSARMQLLNGAQKTVLIQYLIWKGDESGWLLANKLIELKKRGLNVQVIVDPISNLNLQSQNLFSKLVNNGISVHGFQPFFRTVLSRYSTDPGDLFASANYHYHEKMFIIDPEISDRSFAIIGGTNAANEYFRVDPTVAKNNWTDKDIIVRGEIVQDVAQMWQDNYNEVKAQSSASAIWDAASYLQDLLIQDPTHNAVIQSKVLSLSSINSNFSWQPANMRLVQSRPKLHEVFINKTFVDFVSEAKTNIVIANAYFLPSADIQQALIAAARRGVNIRILTNSKDSSDYPVLVVAARTLYKSIASVNQEIGTERISIYEWGGQDGLGNGEGLFHSKYAVFDQTGSIVGSYNIDPRSKNFNSECIIAFDNPVAAGQLYAEFETYIGAKFAKKISWQEIQSFKDPDGFLQTIQARFLENLIPLL